jgi:hypothetical protein
VAVSNPIGRSFLDVYLRLAPGTSRDLARQLGRPMTRAAESSGAGAGSRWGSQFGNGVRTGLGPVQRIVKSVSTSMKVAAVAAGAGIVTAGALAVRGISKATRAASDLNETVNKTKAIFKGSFKEIYAWSKGSAKSMGLSRQEALANAAAFGDMFLQLKIGRPRAVDMSKGMVRLAADFASFHNADITDVLLAQQSAFRGEYDALQRFVPGINAARVEQEALRATHKKSAKDLTLAEKAQATYNIMLRDGKRATGDYARTAQDLANTNRSNKAQWQDLTATVGKAFLPAQLLVSRHLGNVLLPVLGRLAEKHGPAVAKALTRITKTLLAALPSGQAMTAMAERLVAWLSRIGTGSGAASIDGLADSFARFKAGGGLDRLVARLKELGPELKAARAEVGSLHPVLQLAGAGTRFLGQHIDTITKHLPLLIAAFVAWKVAQAASNAAQAVSVALLPVQIAAQIAHALALRRVAAAQTQLALATVGSTTAGQAQLVITQATTLSTLRGGAAALAHKVAVLGTAAAHKVAGAAAAIYALAMGKAGVAADTTAIKTTAAGVAADGAAGKLSRFGGAAGLARLGLLGLAVAGVAVAAGKMKTELEKSAATNERYGRTAVVGGKGGQLFAERLNQLDDANRGVAAAHAAAAAAAATHTARMQAARGASDALKAALTGQRDTSLDLRQAKLNVATAQARLTELTKGGKKGSLEYRQAQIDLRRAQIDLKAKTDAHKESQKKATAAIETAKLASRNAGTQYGKFGDAARTAGSKALTMGREARAGLAMIKSKSVSITTTFGFKTPPKTSLHAIVGATGGKVTPRAVVPMRRARGGPVWGAGTTTSDEIPAYLSDQEHVWDAAAVKGKGGGSYQRGHRILAAERREARGYAGGGPVLDAKIASGSVMGRVGGRYNQVMDRAVARFAAKWQQYAVKNFSLTGGKPAILNWIRAQDPKPYVYGGAGPGSFDCSGIVSAVHGLMRGLANAGRGLRLYTTATIRAGMHGLKSGLGGVLDIGVTPTKGHMVGRYGGKSGLGFEAESSRTGIKIGGAASRPESFARHFHLARGGPVARLTDLATRMGKQVDISGDPARLRARLFDGGGTLRPGLNLAYNGTGRPESLVPAGPDHLTRPGDLAAAVAGALQGAAVELNGEKVGELIVDPAFRELRRMIRGGSSR